MTTDNLPTADINRLLAELDAWQRVAKDAMHAFEDCMRCCETAGNSASSVKPSDYFHPGDWKRMQNWKALIEKGCAALAAVEGTGC